MALEGAISMTVSQTIIDETLDVLARKFGATADELAEAKAIIQEAARTITPTVHLDVIKEDPPDNRILECAVTAGSNYIVTGDKDLLRLDHYDAIQIVTASELVDTLLRLESEG
jgi:putative PIN family toxin of toxin-antitoxin system